MSAPEQPNLVQPGFREMLMQAVNVQAAQPSLVEQTYGRVGLTPPPNVSSDYAQSSVSQLKPGDIVGWHGGQEATYYQGNLAVYMGNGEILEPFFGSTRRRAIDANENCFGVRLKSSDSESFF